LNAFHAFYRSRNPLLNATYHIGVIKWYWVVNDSQADGNVQAGNIFPYGYVFPPGVTGIFDNQQGVAYVSVVGANLH
jgi:hypothetical protein